MPSRSELARTINDCKPCRGGHKCGTGIDGRKGGVLPMVRTVREDYRHRRPALGRQIQVNSRFRRSGNPLVGRSRRTTTIPMIGGVAQLVRVPDCRSGGCGFESRRPRCRRIETHRTTRAKTRGNEWACGCEYTTRSIFANLRRFKKLLERSGVKRAARRRVLRKAFRGTPPKGSQPQEGHPQGLQHSAGLSLDGTRLSSSEGPVVRTSQG